MKKNSDTKRFSEDHEWVRVKGGIAIIGITSYAAEEMGDITFVELPDVGITVAQGDTLGVVESVKTAADVYSPVGGIVSEVNDKLTDDPGLVNDSPEQQGWICKLVEFDESDLESLMTEEEYEEFTAEESVDEGNG